MMRSFQDQEANPAEPVPDVATAAEPPQPPEQSFEDEALGGASRSLNAEEPPQIDVSESELNADVNPPSFADSRTERTDKYAQTFVKYAKNLPIRRLVELINTPVDHEDNSLIFYCTSEDLIRSFEDGVTPARK